MGGSPSAHAKGGSRIAPSLRRGLGYLALDPDDTVSSFLRLLAEAHTPFLWLTTEQPRAPAEGGEVLRVTTIRGAGTADPRRLQDIHAVATTFFDERGPGALVFDCPSERRLTPLDHDEPVVAFEAEASGLAHRDALTAHQVIAQEDVRLLRMSRRKSEHSIHASPQGSVRNKEFNHPRAVG